MIIAENPYGGIMPAEAGSSCAMPGFIQWYALRNYSAITSEGCDSRNSDKFYHWGALLCVIALLEHQKER